MTTEYNRDLKLEAKEQLSLTLVYLQSANVANAIELIFLASYNIFLCYKAKIFRFGFQKLKKTVGQCQPVVKDAGKVYKILIIFESLRNKLCEFIDIQLFRERFSEKMCTRQSRKVIWDMINTLAVPDTVAIEFTFVAFLQHSQTYCNGLYCHSFKFL